MCFGSSEADTTQSTTVDLLKDAASHGGVPSAPVELSTSMIRSQASALNKLAGALDEVANGIDGQQMDMDKME